MSFHEGELAVQERAGVRDEAARLVGLLDRAELRGGASQFLRERTFAVLSACDPAGRLWVAPLAGPPGFLEGDGPRLHVHARPVRGDALHGVVAGQPVGLLVIELATRRRIRVNGNLSHSSADGLMVEVREAFGNCPQYIHRRHLVLRDDPSTDEGEWATSDDGLRPSDVGLIEAADTFFLGTTHPERGPDASHRGGPPGFVRVAGNELTWPDYPGNNMFNSFGNLAIDDTAALLFLDFETGASLELTGTARVVWDGPTETGRQVRFTVARVARGVGPVREFRAVAPTGRS